MFPQRSRNNLSKIMRVICGFTSCALTLAALAIVPVASSSASTEGTAKTAENSEIKGDQKLKNQDEHKADKKAEKQADKQADKKAEQKPEQQPGSQAEKKAETKTDPKNEASSKAKKTNQDKKADQDSKSDQNSKDKKASEDATGSNEDRSSAGNNQASAQNYNPEYQNTPSIVAGNLSTSANNQSGAPRSKPIRGKKNIKRGLLPAGTKFEIKPDAKDKDDASKWAVFEGEQCDNSKECTTTKAIPTKNGSASKYGVITFRPNRWTKEGSYKVQVVVRYPDGTTSDATDAGNSKEGKSSPVYAYVNVTRFSPQTGDLKLSISSKDKEDLKYGQSDNSDLLLMAGKKIEKTTFDSSVHLGVGNINQRMICYEKDSDGKTVAGSYKLGEINGLTLDEKDVKVWKHASYDQQKKCFDDPANGCKMDDLLYDDYVYDNYVKTHTDFEPKQVNEYTVGKLTGTVEKTGNFVCKVYALRNSVKDDGAQDKQDDALVKKFDQIAKNKSNNIDEIDSALKSEDLFKSNKGITWEAKTLNITVRKMSYYYQPNYGDGINTLPGQDATSIVPVNKCGVGGDNCNSKLARTHDLPDGTWFEIKQCDGDSEHQCPYLAYFKGNQSNKPDDVEENKRGKDSSPGSGKEYGKITVKMSTWNKTGDYYVPVVAHYPDGSSSEDKDSSNEGKPIYLKVSVNNSVTIVKGDLNLRVTAKKASAGGVAGSEGDDYGDVDPDQGIFLMRGVGSMNTYLDAWSLRDVDKKISLRVLCTKLNKDGNVDNDATWSSTVNGLSTPTENQIHKWDHIKTVTELKNCEKTPASCDASRTLFRRDVEASDWDVYNPFYAVERTDSIIGGAPTETGDYQCAVYALKPKALDAYNAKFANGATSVQNGDTLLDGAGLEEDKDWTMTSFPIHVVEPFKLPKTGFAGWNMLLGGLATVSTCLMVLAFALDQTKLGRAFMKNFVYQNSAQKVSEIAVQKGNEVSARKGTEIKERK